MLGIVIFSWINIFEANACIGASRGLAFVNLTHSPPLLTVVTVSTLLGIGSVKDVGTVATSHLSSVDAADEAGDNDEAATVTVPTPSADEDGSVADDTIVPSKQRRGASRHAEGRHTVGSSVFHGEEHNVLTTASVSGDEYMGDGSFWGSRGEANPLEIPKEFNYDYNFNGGWSVYSGVAPSEGSQTAVDRLSKYRHVDGDWKPVPVGLRIPRPENAEELERTAAKVEAEMNEKAHVMEGQNQTALQQCDTPLGSGVGRAWSLCSDGGRTTKAKSTKSLFPVLDNPDDPASESAPSGSDYSETQRALKLKGRRHSSPHRETDGEGDSVFDLDRTPTLQATRGGGEVLKKGKGKAVSPLKKIGTPLSGARGRPSQRHVDEANHLKQEVKELIAASANRCGTSEAIMAKLAGFDGPARQRNSNLWNLFLQVRAHSDNLPQKGICGLLSVTHY